jgi:hypothetical protein
MLVALNLHSNRSERPHSSFVAHPAAMAAGEDELGVDISDQAGAWGGSGLGSASPRAFPNELSGNVVVRALPVHPLLLSAPNEGGNSSHIRATVEGGGSDCIASGRATAHVKSI